jgi:hypothetical protein
MGVNWREEERVIVERGMADHSIESGRCAALARVVYRVAKPNDPSTQGIHI